MRVKWTRIALINLDDAVDYIAGDNPVAAKKVAQRIWNSSQMPALQPGLGRPGRIQDTRELIISDYPYILPYSHEGDASYILLRVIHTSLMWPEVKKAA